MSNLNSLSFYIKLIIIIIIIIKKMMMGIRESNDLKPSIHHNAGEKKTWFVKSGRKS